MGYRQFKMKYWLSQRDYPLRQNEVLGYFKMNYWLIQNEVHII